MDLALVLVFFLLAAFGLAVLSVTGIIAVHKMFGPKPPAQIRRLADTLELLLPASAMAILGPFGLLKRLRISNRETQSDLLRIDEIKKSQISTTHENT